MCHKHPVNLSVDINFTPCAVIHIEVNIEDSKIFLERELCNKHWTLDFVSELNCHSSFILNEETKSIW
jgi:hypothetical protein